MQWKLLTIVLTAAAIALSLLVFRQRRIESAHQMSVIHQRLIEQERAVWTLRREIAERCRRESVLEMMKRVHNEWKTIPSLTEPMDQPRQHLAGEPQYQIHRANWTG